MLEIQVGGFARIIVEVIELAGSIRFLFRQVIGFKQRIHVTMYPSGWPAAALVVQVFPGSATYSGLQKSVGSDWYIHGLGAQ